MSDQKIPTKPDFSEIRQFLPEEREALLKLNSFSEDDEFVRPVEDAKVILDYQERFITKLHAGFEAVPSLMGLFNEEFDSFKGLIERESIVEQCLLDDYLLFEEEDFHFSKDGKIDRQALENISVLFENWIENKLACHEDSQSFLREEFHLHAKFSDLACPCSGCMATFRTKVRDTVYRECLDAIEETEESIFDNIDLGLEAVSDIYFRLQKKLDRNFIQVRSKLKRSSLNRLESQVKNVLKSKFTYPSELGLVQVERIRPFFQEYLRAQGLKRDLVDDIELDRFFRQLQTNIWRNERYLEREFKKLLKSVLALKRKDISAKILKDYLGEFWVYTPARKTQRKIIYHMGPTNSGKTYHAIEAVCKAPRGCYLAPLRLLAAELYDTMNSKGVMTSLLTGEEVIEVPNSSHYSSTIEMAKLHERFDCCVIDEIQMITDSQRGWAWTRALVNLQADEIHVCGDASAYDLVKQITDLCGDSLEIKEYERMTALEVMDNKLSLPELNKSDALIVFSRRNALKFKSLLEDQGFKVSIVYGRLSPEVRREQARKFDIGETDIMVSTDAIAMGMNLPIKRIVFSTLSKFINNQEHVITESEIKQIAGRAGRFNRFPTGYVSTLKNVDEGPEMVRRALKKKLNQSKLCMVGPDLDIFNQVNHALTTNSLPILKLSEFLRLFNTMAFKEPFFCVDLKEMIELAEMVEEVDKKEGLSSAEIFGFACAPVNLGLMEHVQYYVWILNHYANGLPIHNELIDTDSRDIDYLETSIKCVELYQWLSRHFNNKHFSYSENELLENKSAAVERLNLLLSDKIERKDDLYTKRPRRRRYSSDDKGRSSGNGPGRKKNGRRRPSGGRNGKKPADSFKKGRPPRRKRKRK